MTHRGWSVSMTMITRTTTITKVTGGFVDFALHHHEHPLLGAVSRPVSGSALLRACGFIYAERWIGHFSPRPTPGRHEEAIHENDLLATRPLHVCIRVLTSSGTSRTFRNRRWLRSSRQYWRLARRNVTHWRFRVHKIVMSSWKKDWRSPGYLEKYHYVRNRFMTIS